MVRTYLTIPRLFQFTMFSLISLCMGAQDYSTRGEIFDFDVGDVFHKCGEGTEVNTPFFDTLNIEIIDKEFSADTFSVTYVYYRRGGTYLPTYQKYYYYEDSIEVTFNNLPDIFICDSVYSNSTYNYRKQSFVDYDDPPYIAVDKIYVDGCGLAYHSHFNTEEPFSIWTRELVYYKKGDEEWGYPHIVVGIDEVELAESNILLYPNPASNIIRISSVNDLKIHMIRIFNQIGQCVLIETADQNHLNISMINRGIYVVEITTEKRKIFRKLIKE